MNTGMLWFDNDPKTDLTAKVARAAHYYQHKYGRKPNLCFVHPSLIGKELLNNQGIEIRPNKRVLVNHLWLGINEP